MSIAGVICLPSRTPSPSHFGEVLGEWGAEVWLDELPLFRSDLVVMDDLDLGEEVVTGDLDENLHVYTLPQNQVGDWLVADEDQAPAFKRQRLDVPFDETGPCQASDLPPANVAPPPPPSDDGSFRALDLASADVVPPPASLLSSGFVDAAWASGLVAALGGLTRTNEEEWKKYLVDAFGATSGSSAPRKDAVRKAVLMDQMLLALSQQTCQDTRMPAEIAGSAIVVPEMLADDAAPLTRFLRPGRSFRVSDPLAFNVAFRTLQASHPEWPRVRGSPEGTKGMPYTPPWRQLKAKFMVC